MLVLTLWPHGFSTWTSASNVGLEMREPCIADGDFAAVDAFASVLLCLHKAVDVPAMHVVAYSTPSSSNLIQQDNMHKSEDLA